MKCFLIYILIFWFIFSLNSTLEKKEESKNENIDILFEYFQKKYDISYRTDNEKSKAKNNFYDNMNRLQQSNSDYFKDCLNKRPLTYLNGINKFSDYTENNYNEILNKIFIDPNSFGYSNFQKYKSDKIRYGNFLENLIKKYSFFTSSFNLFNLGASDINNNHSNGSIKNKNYENEKKIIFDWRKTSIFEKVDPFKQNPTKNKTPEDINFHRESSEYKDIYKMLYFHKQFLWSESYSNLHVENYKKFFSYLKYDTIEELEDILRNIGPIYIEIMSYGIEKYSKGIFDPYACGYRMKIESTGVFLVGFGVENRLEYWIAKNLWGDDWGEESGYFRILKNDSDDIFSFNRNVIVLKINDW